MSYKAGSVVIDIKADTARLVTGMDKAEKAVTKSINNIQKTIVTLASAYAGIQGVRAFKNMVSDSLDAADSTGKLAQKLGLTTDALSEYQYAAGFAAVSNGELNAGLSALIRRLNNFQSSGGGAAKKAFLELGISSEYARKNFTSTDIAFKEILLRLEEMPDGYKKTSIAQDIFSKSASSMLRLTSSDLEKFSKEAKRIGVSISQSTYEMAAAYHDQMDQLYARMKGIRQTVAFSVVEPMNAASKTAVDFIDNVFGGTAQDKMTSFENIAVTSISNIIYSFGTLTDSVSGIELVLKTAELGFVYLVKGIVEAFNVSNRLANSAFEKYNSLPDWMRGGKIELNQLRDVSVVDNQIDSIKAKIGELTNELTNGGITADEYAKKFIANLAKIKSKALEKKTTSSDENGSNGADKKISEKQNKLEERAKSLYTSIMGTEYDKWLQSTNEKMKQLGESGIFTDEQLRGVFDTLQQDYEIKIAINGIDEAQSQMDKMYDTQLSLMQTGMNWGNSLKGTSKDIANVSKAMQQYAVIGVKSEKAQADLSSKFAKDWLSASKDKDKQKRLEAKFDEDLAQQKDMQFSAEMGAYANLAGAMAGAFEQGSGAAVAFTAVQAALGIASSWTAIAQAWAMPFPANLGAVATVAGAVMPIIAQLGGSSSGGSGGGSISVPSVADAKIEDTNNYYDTIIGKFDRQIQLLESINRNGTAGRLKVLSAGSSFDRESALSGLGVRSSIEEKMKDISERAGVDVNSLYNSQHRTHGIVDPIEFFSHDKAPKLFKDFFGTGGVAEVFNDWFEQVYGLTDAEYKKMQSEYQQSITDYATNVIGSINDLRDAGQTLRDTYDNLTGSTKYQTETLQRQFDEVDKLRGDTALPSYIEDQVANIDTLNGILDNGNLEILLKQDPSGLKAQVDLIREISDKTGLVFKNGAEDVLNYLDSINAVSDAMAKSAQNQQSFMDKFRTSEQKTEIMAQSLGVHAAKTTDGVIELFKQLSGGIGGLTDKELEFLNANLAVTGTFDDIIQTFQEVADLLQGTIDKLYGTAIGSSYSFEQYQKAMSAALNANPSDAETYKTLAQEAANKSSVLFDSNNFETSKDQQFAQLVAAKQFEGIQDKSLTQIGYLRQIEENTRALAEYGIGVASDGVVNTGSVYAFAEGGIVTSPTMSLIGEAGYNEAVIPLKDSNDPLQTKEIVSTLKDVVTILIQSAEDGRESRKLSEDQLATLLDIEEKIA